MIIAIIWKHSALHFLDGVDEEQHELRVMPPVALWYDTRNTVVQVRRSVSRIASVAHLADDRMLGNDGPDVSIDFAHVGIVVQPQSRAEHHNRIAALAEVMSHRDDDAPDGGMNRRTLTGKDIYATVVMVAPWVPERLGVVALLAASFHRILYLRWQQHANDQHHHSHRSYRHNCQAAAPQLFPFHQLFVFSECKVSPNL